MATKKQLARELKIKLLKVTKNKSSRDVIKKLNFNKFLKKNLEKAIRGTKK